MIIEINDDFDLKKIVESGQCFRPVCIEPGFFRFITGKNILFIKEISDNKYDVSCDTNTWKEVWHKYFDLDNNYLSFREAIPKDDNFLVDAAKNGAGIRILNQDRFEMLISFIISQRKSIPAIRSSIEKICSFYGKKVDTECGEVFLFPSAEDIVQKGFEDLAACSLGYRLPYIEEACSLCASGAVDLDDFDKLDDDKLLETLMKFKGVGIKVASCVALFAYRRGQIAPVDTWILKVIEKYYSGNNPYVSYGNLAGIYQQYAFYSSIKTGV